MKVFFRRIHLYLGLAAGLVILIACATGALLVFQKELEQAFNKSRYFTQAQGTPLPVDSLVQKVKAAYPTAAVNSVKVYADKERNVEISLALPGKEGGERKEAREAPARKKPPSGERPGNARGGEGRAPGVTAFVDPYTGGVKELYNNRESFFFKVMSLHRWLLGGNDSVGKYIVGVSTAVFLFILITGFVLWWPKTKRILAQRLKVKSKAGWKRLNHDLHVVLGFYSGIFLFVFAFTALPMSFQWFNKGIYTVTRSPQKSPEPPKSSVVAEAKKIGFGTALQTAALALPDAVYYTVAMPKDSAGAVSITALSNGAVHETAPDVVYLDQYSGAVIGKQLYRDRSAGAKVRSTFRPVHVGSIWGLPSKIIAFVVCLLGVTFPVTGTILWINRTRKGRKRVKGATVSEVAEVDEIES